MKTRIIAAVVVASAVGCGADPSDNTSDATQELQPSDAEIAASCSLENPKKVAICHIPPGNPANAHTICISQHAVDTHNSHHGDYLGACEPSEGSGGSGGSSSGAGGSSSGSGGSGGAPTPEDSECSEEYPSCVSHDECAIGESCLLGCCVPFAY